MKAAEPTCSTTFIEGDYPAAPAGTCSSLMRYAVKITEPTTLAASLGISGEDMRAATRLVLVDNASGAESVVPLCRLPARELPPTPQGYTLVAISDIPSSVRLPARPGKLPPEGSNSNGGGGVLEDGNWALTVTSSRPAVLEPIPSDRVQVSISTNSTLYSGGLGAIQVSH